MGFTFSVLDGSRPSWYVRRLHWVEALSQPYEIDVESCLQGSSEPRDCCVQFRESDLDFCSRLLEEQGIADYFESDRENGREKLVLLDGNALTQSSGGSKVLLDGNAQALTAMLAGGGGSVIAGVTCADGQVNVSGGMVNVSDRMVKIN